MDCNMPYRYRISDWHQLTRCLSNNSRDLSITVTDFIQNFKLNGIRIQVSHNEFGVMFACVVNSSGSLISSDSSNWAVDMTPASIIQQLAKFGFLVEYSPVDHLPGHQLRFLQTISKLNFDKLRVLPVNSLSDGSKSVRYCLVAFNVKDNPTWINSSYVASSAEYLAALSNGSAMNLENISDQNNYDWSWLDYVANISDILRDNATYGG